MHHVQRTRIFIILGMVKVMSTQSWPIDTVAVHIGDMDLLLQCARDLNVDPI